MTRPTIAADNPASQIRVDLVPLDGWEPEQARQAAAALRHLHRPARPTTRWRLRCGLWPQQVRQTPTCWDCTQPWPCPPAVYAAHVLAGGAGPIPPGSQRSRGAVVFRPRCHRTVALAIALATALVIIAAVITG